MKRSLLLLLTAFVAAPFALQAGSDIDDKIEQAAKNSYNFRTVLDDQVKVKASEGAVTLSGTVRDPDLRTLAENTVRDLPGVVAVKNEIKISAEDVDKKSDSWIAFKARATLLTKANISSSNTKLDVKEGVVTLTGSAENEAQRELTEAYIKDIEGVKSVNNQIAVGRPASGETAERPMGEKIDDASISAQVKYALLTHRSTSALRTEVATRNGIVTLGGQATSSAEKDLVTKLARDVKGVQSVNNQMRVAE